MLSIWARHLEEGALRLGPGSALMVEGPRHQPTALGAVQGEVFLSSQVRAGVRVPVSPWSLGPACWTGEAGGLTGHPSCLQLTNAGDDVVVFYNDKASLAHLLDMMKAARDGVEDHSPLMYHISLVDLLAACAEGKNVYTEIKCTSLLPLEDVVSVVTHEDCITEVFWGLGEVVRGGVEEGQGSGGGRARRGQPLSPGM